MRRPWFVDLPSFETWDSLRLPASLTPVVPLQDGICRRKGGSKASPGKICRTDSSSKDSQRLVGSGAGKSSHAIAEGDPINAVTAMKDFTFHPTASVVMPSQCLHLDNEHYHNSFLTCVTGRERIPNTSLF